MPFPGGGGNAPMKHTLGTLIVAMSRYPAKSHAWQDFIVNCRERLVAQAIDEIIVPDDMWEYWSAVAASDNRDDYRADGARVVGDHGGNG
jgi:hypothetical protein